MLCDQKHMEKEIELSIKINFEAMHESIRELKETLEKEAKFMEGI